MTENYKILVDKLNSFKNRFYLFQIIKGVLLTIFVLLFIYLVFSLLEYFLFMHTGYRKILFFGYIIFGILLFVQLAGIPFLKMIRAIPPMNSIHASVFIQRKFQDIQDKLLNIIELSNYHGNEYSNDVVLASIDQKINELKIFDFKRAVDFRDLRYVGAYFLISLVITGILIIADKKVLTESTKRLIHYNQTFEKPAPYTFYLLNEDLNAKKGDPFIINLRCTGEEIPQVMYVYIDGNPYMMKSTGINSFTFEMSVVINPVQFYFSDMKNISDTYSLTLLPKPGINNFTVDVQPPAYTGLKAESTENRGDLQIPEGSVVVWKFSGIDIDSMELFLENYGPLDAEIKDNIFIIKKQLFTSSKYDVYVKNNLTGKELVLSYFIEVIPDFYPEIEVFSQPDSGKLTRLFFRGNINDDYGFSALNFHFNIQNQDSSVAIPIIKSPGLQEFFFGFDFKDVKKDRESITYYFSVADNDKINGYKISTTEAFMFTFPDENEIQLADKNEFEKIQEKMLESQNLAKEIQRDLKEMKMKNMDTGVSEWEKTKQVNELVKKQSRLEQLYEQIKRDNENLNNYLNSYDVQNQEIIEKQKEIEKLLDEVFTEELKQLLEEFNNLANQFDSKKFNELSERMNMSYEDLQKQLDRNLEMLKKMKIEERIIKNIEKIKEFAEQNRISIEEIEKKKNFKEINDKISDQQFDLQGIENELRETIEMNNELTKPLVFDEFSEEFKDIGKELENTIQELNKENRKKSEEGLKNSAEKLDNLAFSMEQMLKSNKMKQNMENIENLKQILSNLIMLSFSQENILTDFKNTNTRDPEFNRLNKEQKRISDQSQLVKDSLYALSMRTPQINQLVNNELLTIEYNLKSTRELLDEGLISNAAVNQQLVMTSWNNLALMLNEALENLEKQMAEGMEGDQECENPGNGKPGMNMLKQTADDMKRQLQEMIEQMKNNQGKPMNKQFGEALMQHEMMQQMLRDLMNNGSVGSETVKKMQQVDQLLEMNRKELMNKSINAQTLMRQNLITTRLLEAENAELKREFEDKRESESAEEYYSNPLKYFEMEKKEDSSLEYIQKNIHSLTNFYQNKYKEYIKSIENSIP